MKSKKEILSVQDWIPIEYFLDNGIIKLKNNNYLKIIKIYPINYNLKSELEKKSILNLIIQSNKEDLSKHINKIKKQNDIENNYNLINLSQKYINFINKKNKEKNSSSKNFYILIKFPNNIETNENAIIQELKDNYLKIKDSLSRCGNIVEEVKNKKEIEEIFFSFLNTKKYLNKEVI